MTLRGMILIPLRWWAQNPWKAFWGAVIALFGWILFVGFEDSPFHSPTYTRPFDGVIVGSALIVTCASFIRGVWVIWCRSKVDAIIAISIPVALVILGVFGVVMMANLRTRARIHLVETKVRTLTDAIDRHSAHMGSPPAGLADLTSAVTNAQGQVAGPFLSTLPTPPATWSEYRYKVRADGTYSVTSSGDGVTVTGSAEGVERVRAPPARAFWAYIGLWATACLGALALYIKDRKAYALSHAAYWRFLFKPWKVVTFLVAATGLTVIAPYTGDPTWDYFNAPLMSVLTFCTAPWVIGACYKFHKKDLPVAQAFVAVCLALFSASWSYDLYLLIRDGSYPVTWWANLFASLLLYITAGLLWNLDWRAERGVVLAFREAGWPAPSAEPVFARVLWPALVFMILVSLIFLLFFWQAWR